MSRRTLRCLRCGGTMELLRREFLQLGKTGWVLGDLDNLLAGALDVDILCCSDCGKLEFFRGEWSGLSWRTRRAAASPGWSVPAAAGAMSWTAPSAPSAERRIPDCFKKGSNVWAFLTS